MKFYYSVEIYCPDGRVPDEPYGEASAREELRKWLDDISLPDHPVKEARIEHVVSFPSTFPKSLWTRIDEAVRYRMLTVFICLMIGYVLGWVIGKVV